MKNRSYLLFCLAAAFFCFAAPIPAVAPIWTWFKGDALHNRSPIFGTRNTPSTANRPGAREGAATWTDSSGRLWLFGGYSSQAEGYLNDLWRYDPASSSWTWVSGGTTTDLPGVYGTLGTPNAANVPGARDGAAAWIDSSNRLWLFGGFGYDMNGDLDDLNDVWRFDISSGTWTWLKGSRTVGQSGVYGTRTVTAAANTPGARDRASVWTDRTGRFWLMGGYGYDATGSADELNDVWRLDSSGNWTWMAGSNAIAQAGVYGTMGYASSTNIPGARDAAATWTDSAGTYGQLWLFGGYGYDSNGDIDELNDLWVLNLSTGQWKWEYGSNTVDAPGDYGIQGVSANTNTPGARDAAAHWTDSFGQLWLFGGSGYDSAGTTGNLNDLWELNPATGIWTWVKGSDVVGTDSTGVYGSKGTPAATNLPGIRASAATWAASSGHLWFFGGWGYDSNNLMADTNDLWRLDTSTSNWVTSSNFAWIGGSPTSEPPGAYGAAGTPSTTNTPGARNGGSAWIDSSKKLWTFGGWGYDVNGTGGDLSDLWRYDTATGNWTWIKGSNVVNQSGVYGTVGSNLRTNNPGARDSGATWTDKFGRFWLFGGWGYDKDGNVNDMSDLWRFDTVSGNWIWVAGDNTGGLAGLYGSLGVPSINNIPGARDSAATWVDSSARLWMFGGFGFDVNGDTENLNDLWRYDPVGNTWTWLKGGQTVGALGVYGTKGTPAAINTPGARHYSASWIDGSGRLWLFGGQNGADTAGIPYLYNDLWRYDPATGYWTWLKGDQANDSKGVYGTRGTAAATNNPGARSTATTWIGSDGKLWLFGGYGVDVDGNKNYLNDLWALDPATGNWTWIGGSNAVDSPGFYGVQGRAGGSNIAGARKGAVSAVDSTGQFWLFGGAGLDQTGYTGLLNDLWMLKPSTAAGPAWQKYE